MLFLLTRRPHFPLIVLLLALGLVSSHLAAQRPLPPSKGSPQVGQKAPDFTLPDTSANRVKLSDLLAARAAPGANGSWLLLIFYRGYW